MEPVEAALSRIIRCPQPSVASCGTIFIETKSMSVLCPAIIPFRTVMDYIRFAISNPVKVTVGVLLLVLFGMISLATIPVQLAPDVDQPIITVETDWTGRSPEEVEREIVDEQEDKLKGISEPAKDDQRIDAGQGHDHTGVLRRCTNIDRALQEVSDKLRQVPDYPEDVDEPVITAADSTDANAMAWLILYSDAQEFDIQGFLDTADKRVKPHLERVAGVEPDQHLRRQRAGSTHPDRSAKAGAARHHV